MQYLSIQVPGRSSVREPLSEPTLRLIDGENIVTVPLTERQLYEVITDASEALKRLYARREATVPV